MKMFYQQKIYRKALIYVTCNSRLITMANVQVICNLFASFQDFPVISSGSKINNEGGGGDEVEVWVDLRVEGIITETLKDVQGEMLWGKEELNVCVQEMLHVTCKRILFWLKEGTIRAFVQSHIS